MRWTTIQIWLYIFSKSIPLRFGIKLYAASPINNTEKTSFQIHIHVQTSSKQTLWKRFESICFDIILLNYIWSNTHERQSLTIKDKWRSISGHMNIYKITTHLVPSHTIITIRTNSNKTHTYWMIWFECLKSLFWLYKFITWEQGTAIISLKMSS